MKLLTLMGDARIMTARDVLRKNTQSMERLSQKGLDLIYMLIEIEKHDPWRRRLVATTDYRLLDALDQIPESPPIDVKI